MALAPPRPRRRRAPLLLLLGALALALGAALPGCKKSPAPARSRGVIDAHLHLTADEAVSPLLELMDRYGIERAAVLASPNITRGIRGEGLEGYREGNSIVLRAGAAHPGRLLPFVTVDLAQDPPDYLRGLVQDGACGVKLYQGHDLFRVRRLDDPIHHPLLQVMSDLDLPVLLHANTAKHLDELENVLRAFPHIRLVCAHYCSAKTDLDRLEALIDAFPGLLLDTSNGAVSTAIPGLMSLEADRERVRALFVRAPDRFLFGSDLVTLGAAADGHEVWEEQITMNTGILRGDPFRYWRPQDDAPGAVRGVYQGIDLPPDVLAAVLHDNAAKWLARCIDRR